MNIESQVCSLELAKRLKEFGVKQQSLFCWNPLKDSNEYVLFPVSFNLDEFKKPPLIDENDKAISAFTASELLAILPNRITLPDNEPYNSFRIRIEKGIWCIKENSLEISEFYSVNYCCDTTSIEMDWLFPSLTKNISDENFANALAKMLVYLVENKMVIINPE